MDRTLEAELESARERRDLAARLQGKLQAARDDLARCRERCRELELVLAKEEQDVQGLQGLGPTALLSGLLGTREQKLDRERQELAAAQLKYEAGRGQVEALEEEVAALRERLASLGQAEEEYLRLLRQKEEALKSGGGEAAAALLELAEEEGRLSSSAKELEEALAAAREALASLDDLLAALGSAASWGIWDIVGGGLLATAIKHSRIDDARGKAALAQQSLSWLQREMADVGGRVDLGVGVGGFLTFADYFFDGLIVDWVVQSRISEARSRTEEQRAAVASMQRRLEEELRRTAAMTEDVRRKRQRLVEVAQLP
ncbi:MAG: hypothetical protein AB1503_02490 [Bacillota bacterium]